MSEEVRDNMRIVWDAPIEISDGVVLRADVFRPVGENTIPAILSYGPYAKGMSSRGKSPVRLAAADQGPPWRWRPPATNISLGAAGIRRTG